MPHGNVERQEATAQNAATDPQQPNDAARGQHVTAHPEARSYAAPDYRDSSMAAPAAGEMGDYADLSTPSGGMAQGADRTNWPAHSHTDEQGPKTQAAQQEQLKGQDDS